MLTKKLIFTVLGVVALFTSHSARAAVTLGNEHQAIVNTALNYVKGAALGDQSLLSESFDTDFGDVKMIRVDEKTGKETIRTVPLAKFATYFKEATQDAWNANVLAVDVENDKMAMVKLDFHTSKTHYVDYLVMYKRNNEWRIVNKTFVATKK